MGWGASQRAGRRVGSRHMRGGFVTCGPLIAKVVYRLYHAWIAPLTTRLGGFMARGAENQLPLVNVLGAPTLGDGSVGQWDGKESFFPNGLSLVGTFKLRFVKMRPSGPLFDSKLQSISFDRFRTPHGASSTGSSWVGPRRLPLWSRCEPIHLGTCMALSMAHGDRIKRTLVAAKAKRKQSMSNPSVG